MERLLSVNRIGLLVMAGLLLQCEAFAAKLGPAFGDRDFPEVDPNPKHTFVLRGTADPELGLRFFATFGATKDDPACGDGKVVLDPFPSRVYQEHIVFLPIEMSWMQDRFSGVVALDGLLPGKCGWKFFDVRISPQGGVLDPGVGAVGGLVIVQTNPPPLKANASPDSSLHLECKVWPDENFKRCVSCKPEFPPAWLYPDTTSIELELHHVQ